MSSRYFFPRFFILKQPLRLLVDYARKIAKYTAAAGGIFISIEPSISRSYCGHATLGGRLLREDPSPTAAAKAKAKQTSQEEKDEKVIT